MSARCHLCDEDLPEGEGGIEAILEHLRALHPEVYEEPERWPDGGVVIHAADVTPEEFA